MLGMLISWMLVVIPVVLILILMLFLRVIQFITARIAENPKGPILGVSGLLTASEHSQSYSCNQNDEVAAVDRLSCAAQRSERIFFDSVQLAFCAKSVCFGVSENNI
jgi:hypothetical protein